MLYRTTSTWAWAMLGMCFFVGCGGGDPLARQEISGTVTLDGVPVESGSISFEPQGGGAAGASTSSGAAITAGKFTIEEEFGLPAGTYLVRVSIPKPGTGGVFKEGSMPGDMLAPPQEMAPPEWTTKSKNTIEVKADGLNEFPFDIVSKKK